MKKLLLTLALLTSCAHTTLSEEYTTGSLMCKVQVCEDFGAAHGYDVLLARYEDGQCVCRLMSAYNPDWFEIKLPVVTK